MKTLVITKSKTKLFRSCYPCIVDTSPYQKPATIFGKLEKELLTKKNNSKPCYPYHPG